MPETTSSTGEKLNASVNYAVTNGAVIAAPLLPTAANEQGLGGIEVSVIAHGINGIIQALKMHTWYKQDKWAMWTAGVLAIIACAIYWHDNPPKAFLNALATLGNVLTNYGHLNALGVLPGGVD